MKYKQKMKTKLDFHRITLSQEKVLTALAQFKFLTTGQLLSLGVMSDRNNLNKNISELRNRSLPLLGSITFGVHPSKGKLQSVHYLTSHGAELLREGHGESLPVRLPKGNHGLFQQDYFHRVNTITVHIALWKWVQCHDAEILFFCTYFDKLSTGKEKGYRAESAIRISEKEYLIADALFMLKTPGSPQLYALEMYNGDDTQRVHNSLRAHLSALKHGQPSLQFGMDYASRVLCVFEHEVYKIQLMKRLCEDEGFANAKDLFLFKSLEELKTEMFFEWRLFDGHKTELF